jgi:hypothetical protein
MPYSGAIEVGMTFRVEGHGDYRCEVLKIRLHGDSEPSLVVAVSHDRIWHPWVSAFRGLACCPQSTRHVA